MVKFNCLMILLVYRMIMYCFEEVKKLILKLVYLVLIIKFIFEVGFEL